MKGVLSWLVRLACRAGTRDFSSALAALVREGQNIFFLIVHNLNFFVPIAQQAEQAAMLGRLACLFVCVSPNTFVSGKRQLPLLHVKTKQLTVFAY
jgi:hypothetical protein